jgi:hypothetical protein
MRSHFDIDIDDVRSSCNSWATRIAADGFCAPPILDIDRASGSTTEQLMSDRRAGGLGFCLSHIEEAFDKLFDLRGQPDEYHGIRRFSLAAFGRPEPAHQILDPVFTRGVFSLNEARAQEGLPAVDTGAV